MRNAGVTARLGGDRAAARRHLTRRLDLERSRGDAAEEGIARVELARLLSEEGHDEEALALVRPAPALLAKARRLRRLGDAHFQLGVSLARLARDDEALTAYENARRVFARAGLPPEVAATLRNVARAKLRLGLVDEADAVVAAVRRLEGEHGFPAHAETVLLEAELHHRRGRFANALRACDRAETIAKARDDDSALVAALSTAAVVHREMGDYARSVDVLARGLDECARKGLRRDEARLLVERGSTLLEASRFDEAESSYDAALRIYDRLGARGQRLTVAHNRAVMLMRRGRFEAALRVFEELSGEPEGRDLEVGLLLNISTCLYALRRVDAARETRDRARAMAAELRDPESEARALLGLAHIDLEAGSAKRAQRLAARAVDLVGASVANLGDEPGARARGERHDIFAVAIRAAVANGDADALCRFLEAGRAGALREALGGREALGRATLPDDLRAAEDNARAAAAAAVRTYRAALRARDRAAVRAAGRMPRYGAR